MKTTCDET
jgi:hypothetical protein